MDTRGDGNTTSASQLAAQQSAALPSGSVPFDQLPGAAVQFNGALNTASSRAASNGAASHAAMLSSPQSPVPVGNARATAPTPNRREHRADDAFALHDNAPTAYRKTPLDLTDNLLAISVERMMEIGRKRLQKYVKERYLQGKVDLHAPISKADSAKLSLSVSGNGPAAAKAKRGRARQRKAAAPRSRSQEPVVAAHEHEAADSDAELEEESNDYNPRSRSVSRSPSPRAHSRERSAGFVAAVRMQESDDEDA